MNTTIIVSYNNIIIIYSRVWLSPLSYFRFEVSALPLVFASPILTPPTAVIQYNRARDTAVGVWSPRRYELNSVLLDAGTLTCTSY